MSSQDVIEASLPMSPHDVVIEASLPTAVKAAYWFPDGEIRDCGTHITPTDSSATRIDASLFTHLFCAFADLDPSTHQVSVIRHEKWFREFTKTVRTYKKVHTLLSIGGKSDEASALIKAMARNSKLRKSFIDSAIQTARDLDFFGLDLAWQFPSNAVDMANLGQLLKEWRAAIDVDAAEREKVPLLLTAAVYYSSKYNSSCSYPVQVMADTLDWVNVIAFNFYDPGSSSVTGPTAALSGEAPTITSGLKQWFDDKLPKDKVVLGLPYIGWAWTLKNAKDNGYHADTTGPALSSDGAMNYDEVRKYIVGKGAATVHNPDVTGDYCYAHDVWIGYDDNQTIVKKVTFAKETSLRGYFAWHIGADIGCGLSRAANRTWDATEVTPEE